MSAPVVEIVAIGTELMLGETIDTNSAWLGDVLADAGMPVFRRTTVVDDFALMADVLREAMLRADVVITTGGLGPTHDDFTREVVAAVLERPLERNEDWVRVLEERYSRRGIPMPENNLRQAMVPRGGVLVHNPRGSAPALWIEHEGHILVVLPGVPVELYTLGVEELVPRLRARFPDAPPVRSVRIRTTGVGESRLAEEVADLVTAIVPLEVAFLPTLAGVDIRITAHDMPAAQAAAALERAESLFSGRIGLPHFGGSGDVHAAAVGRALQARGWRIALAESCTGGLAAKLMTDVSGASAYVLGGVVAYDNAVKVNLLGVDAGVIEREGAVSDAVARAMASGVRRVTGAECGVAITGIAGPEGGTPDKPVGTVFIAAETPHRVTSRRLSVPGARDDVRERSAVAALELLRRMLLGDEAE